MTSPQEDNFAMRIYLLLFCVLAALSCSRAENPASGSEPAAAAATSAAAVPARNELTREAAKAIIATAEGYPKTITAGVFMGNYAVTAPFSEAEVAPHLVRYEQKGINNESKVAIVRACQLDVLDVTGIATAADGHSADVEYTIKVQTTPFSVRTANVSPEWSCQGGTRKATFKLYDDGWRMIAE